MTREMELRWVWTVCAVVLFPWMIFWPDPVTRFFAAWVFVIDTIQATIAWRAYFEWRVFWDAEQRKGMPD